MKNSLAFLALLVIFLLQTQVILAQNTSNPYGSIYHSNKTFIKASMSGLLDKLEQAKKSIRQDAASIEALHNLSDSLLQHGDISLELSDEVKEELGKLKSDNEAIAQNSSNFNKQLRNFAEFKRNYVHIANNITPFYYTVQDKTEKNKVALKQLEQKMRNASLSREKKVLKTMLNNATSQQQKETAKINDLDKTKVKLLQSGKIDDSVAAKIDSRLVNYQRKIDSVSVEINELQQKIASPEEYSKNGEIIKARVIWIDSIVNKTAASREVNFKMIADGLEKNTKSLFSLAAFFGPGGYSIPEDKYDVASQYFGPVIDSLIKFSNQYADLPRTATLLINGYADGSTIQPSSKVYGIVKNYLNKENPTKEELNIGLSALRAEELSKLFSKIIRDRSASFLTLPKIIFANIEVGRGEQLPDPAIHNYKENDERRRIVIVYWSVLPNL